MSKFFNPKMIKDVDIPGDARFITSISLKKSTYNSINTIQQHPHYFCASRGEIVDIAIALLLKHLNETSEKQVVING